VHVEQRVMFPVARSEPVTATKAHSGVLACETGCAVLVYKKPAAASLRSALETSDTSEEGGFHGGLGIGRIEHFSYVCYSMPDRYVDGEPFSWLECG